MCGGVVGGYMTCAMTRKEGELRASALLQAEVTVVVGLPVMAWCCFFQLVLSYSRVKNISSVPIESSAICG